MGLLIFGCFDNKRGWVRIVEMFIAVLIISSAVLYVTSIRTESSDISEEVYEKQKEIFSVLGGNETFRNEIVLVNVIEDSCNNVPIGSFIDFIDESMPKNWDFTINICDMDAFSNQGSPPDREIYISEMVITSTVSSYPDFKARKVRLSVWRK